MDICVDSRPSIEIDGGEEPIEMESHVWNDGSAEEGEEEHEDGDEGLPAERMEEVEDSCWVTLVPASEVGPRPTMVLVGISPSSDTLPALWRLKNLFLH